jgi:hypothetical protein
MKPDLHALHDEAAGAMTFFVVRQLEVPAFIRAVVAGNRHAIVASRAIEGWFKNFDKIAPPPLCLTCDHAFTSRNEPRQLVVMAPYVDNPRIVSVSGICRRCDALPAEALSAAMLATLRRTWPDARLSPMPTAVGAA